MTTQPIIYITTTSDIKRVKKPHNPIAKHKASDITISIKREGKIKLNLCPTIISYLNLFYLRVR